MSNSLPAITLDELERLIKLLGLLASSHDPEALVAARMAVKWVADHQTDWRTLLTPEPEPAVMGVAAPRDPDAIEAAHQADRAQAYKNGYQAGMRDMTAQLKAQAHVAQYGVAPGSAWTSPAGGPGWAAGSFNPNQQPRQAPAAQGPAAAPGTVGGPLKLNPHPTGSWQWVAQELLERDTQGMPGVFRGSRELDFVASLLARGWKSLTAPQEQWLRDIAGRSGLSW